MAKSPAKSGPKTPGPEHRIVLLHGANQFLASEYLAALKARCEQELGAVDILHFDGASARIADVLDECRSLGLMQQHKVVVVDNAEVIVKEDNRPLVERYAQSPEAGTTLVLRATKWYKGKLDDMIAEHGILIECGDVSEQVAVRWAMARAEKRHNATLAEDAAMTLVERCGAELGRIDSELGKLAANALGESGVTDPDTKAHITKPMVVELVGRSREESAWEWQSTLVTGHTAAALERERYLINILREPPQLLWWACMDLSRKLHAAANALKAGENEFAVAKTLKLWGPAKDAVLAKARELGPAGSREALKLAVEGDQRVKSGLGDAERTLEVVTVRLTSMLKPQSRR